MKHPITRFRETNGGMSLEDLAHELGVNRSTISRIENGHNFPSRKLIGRLVEFSNGALTAESLLFPEISE